MSYSNLSGLLMLAAMAAAGVLAMSGCSNDEVVFFDGKYAMKADTTIYASKASSAEKVTLHHTDRLEDYNLTSIPSSLLGKWRWVGIGSGRQYKPVYSWRGCSNHAITFEQGGIYKMRNGANSIDGTYTVRAGQNTLSIEPGIGTLVGSFSVTQYTYDTFFSECLTNARAYDIDKEGLLRIYYTRTDCLVFVAAEAVPETETRWPELEDLFGEWQMVGVAYGNGIFESTMPDGMVVFNTVYAATATGDSRLLTSSLTPQTLYYLYEYGSLSIGDRLYHATIEGDLLYLCGGLDLYSPTLVLRRMAGSDKYANVSSYILRGGYRIGLFLSNSTGMTTDTFQEGENIVFNIDIINERDTALMLNNPFDLFQNHHVQMIYGTTLERGQMRGNGMSGVGIDTSKPTIINPHNRRHWQCTLYPSNTIETTPPLGLASQSTPYPAGSYYIEMFLMPEDNFALKLRHDFTILPKSDDDQASPDSPR